MTCKRCGICCRTVVTEIAEKDMRQMGFKLNCRGFIKHDGKIYAIMDSECKQFKNNRCKIYDRRPEACKTFPLGSEERWRKINPECGML